MIKIKKYSNAEKIKIKQLSNSLDIPINIMTLIYNRGFETENEVLDYLLKEYQLENPYKLPYMKKSIQRILEALERSEMIVIVGDYDVDGMLATAILYTYLSKVNANVELFLPDREKDGYGIKPHHIQSLKERYNPQVIISVDTGTTAFDTIDTANNLGIDFIITDHHEPSSKLPKAYSIINPKLIKEKSQLENLSGGGIAFYVVRALNAKLIKSRFISSDVGLTNFIILAMISSIADMVPLVGDNRIIVDKGIEFLYNNNLLGLQMLLDKLFYRHFPNANDIAFYVSPILNAPGRLNDPYKTLKVFLDTDLRAQQNVNDVIKLNTKRKSLTKEQSEILLKKTNTSHKFILEYGEYHLGLIGLLANKAMDKFSKTSFVGCELEDEIKFSARSKGDLDLKEFIEKNNDILDGGGHQKAAGFTIKKNQIKELKKRLMQENFIENKKIIEYELELDTQDINYKFLKYIKQMEPFGQGHLAPLVKINHAESYKELDLTQNNHLMIKINKECDAQKFFLSQDQINFVNQHIIKERKPFSILGNLNYKDNKIIINIIKLIS